MEVQDSELEVFLNEKKIVLSPLALKQYKQILSELRKFSGKELKSVTKLDIVSFLSHLYNKNLKKSSISTYQRIIKSFYGYLYENKLLPENPCRNLYNVKPEGKAPVYLTLEEVELLLNAAKNPRDRLIFQILYATGLRVSELINIRYSNIDFKNCTIKVFGKGSRERYVLVREELMGEIKCFCEVNKKSDMDRLFNITARAIELNIKKAAKQVGIRKEVTPHKLRHSFATHMLQRGADIRAIQKLLGHSSLNTTQIYADYSIEDLKKIYNRTHPLKVKPI
ncbi:MAG: tyrosine-type recombinase/integrase [Methanocellales archaeon]